MGGGMEGGRIGGGGKEAEREEGDRVEREMKRNI